MVRAFFSVLSCTLTAFYAGSSFAAAEVQFQRGETISLGNSRHTIPGKIATGDINKDGIPDIAVTNPTSNEVFALLGNGNGTFATPVTVPAANGPSALTIGDFDAQPGAYADMITANLGSGAAKGDIRLFSGLPAPAGSLFQPSITKPIDKEALQIPRAQDIATGDLNDDMLPDIVTANGTDNSFSIVHGPDFNTRKWFASGNTTSAVTLGDVNRDSKLDVVVASGTPDGIVSIHPDNGRNDFSARQDTRLGVQNPGKIIVTDINGDKNPDIVASSLTQGTFSVLLGDGTTSFNRPPQVFVSGTTRTGLATGDIDNDGKPDIITSNEDTNTASVFLGTADTQLFQTKKDFPTGPGPVSLVASDFNKDGRLDLATLNNQDLSVSILLNIAPPQPQKPQEQKPETQTTTETTPPPPPPPVLPRTETQDFAKVTSARIIMVRSTKKRKPPTPKLRLQINCPRTQGCSGSISATGKLSGRKRTPVIALAKSSFTTKKAGATTVDIAVNVRQLKNILRLLPKKAKKKQFVLTVTSRDHQATSNQTFATKTTIPKLR